MLQGEALRSFKRDFENLGDVKIYESYFVFELTLLFLIRNVLQTDISLHIMIDVKGGIKMNFSLIDNGADSLKNAYNCIEKIDNLEDGRDHTLKDAVIFLNHGIEILLKVMLSKRSAALMFENIKDYQKAKVDLAKTNKRDVFEVNPHLKTISLTEALIRVEYLCDIEVENEMKAAILSLNSIRNKLMHFSVTLSDEEVSELIAKLEFCYNSVYDFFEENIEDFTDLIDKARFEYTSEEYYQDKAEWHAEILMEERRLEFWED